MKILKIFKGSFNELSRLKTVIICSLLLAISLILGNYSIKIGNYIVIGFAFITNSIAGALFGPFASGLLGGLSDVIKHFLAPKGAYFFGFTLNGILAGLIYGSFFYRDFYNNFNKKSLLIRIVSAKLLVSIFVNLLLGTLWVSMTTGKSFIVYFSARFIKEIISVPVHSLVLFLVLTALNRIKINTKNNISST